MLSLCLQRKTCQETVDKVYAYLSTSDVHGCLAMGQSFSPLFRGENPRATSPARLFGLVPIGTKPHRKGLLL